MPKYMMFHPAVIAIETDISGSPHGGGREKLEIDNAIGEFNVCTKSMPTHLKVVQIFQSGPRRGGCFRPTNCVTVNLSLAIPRARLLAC